MSHPKRPSAEHGPSRLSPYRPQAGSPTGGAGHPVSVQALCWVLERSEAHLGARLVLISIANHADDRGENAWPSITTIARESRMTPRHVQRVLPELVALGELEVDAGAGPRGVHRYRLVKMTQGTLWDARTPRQIVTPDKLSGVTSEPAGGDILSGGGDISGQNPLTNCHPNRPRTVLRTVLDPSDNTDTQDKVCKSPSGDRFPEFWRLFPRRVGKAAAKRVWSRKGLNAKADEIIDHLRIRVRSDAQWLRDDGRFVPHPATWLNGECWEDEYQTVSAEPVPKHLTRYEQIFGEATHGD